MCGIIGYVGKNNALPIILNGLKNLEYRGYDSSGIAYYHHDAIKIVKSVGKIASLEEILPEDHSHIAIGHTRWATHGRANTINAHPHQIESITLVHNGIIENYQDLKKMLINYHYTFKSETDSEVVAGLIDYYYQKDCDIIKTLERLPNLLQGSYALGIMIQGDHHLYAIRKKSPLIIGLSQDGHFLASDVPAILNYTKKYFLLPENAIAILGSRTYQVYQEKESIMPEIKEFHGDIENALHHGYKHFMLKEINEEPLLVDNLVSLLLNKNMIDLSLYDNIQISACGSAYHAGLIGKYLIEKFLQIKTDVYVASEYRYQTNFFTDKTLFIAISQSGETADTLASLMLVKQHHIHTLGIINTVGSSIAREVDDVIYINAGLEMAVATTKAYVLQCLVFSLLIFKTMQKHSLMSMDEQKSIINDFHNLSQNINSMLKRHLNRLTEQLYKHEDIFFIGRQIDYALCQEASLKLKEISYIHSESYPAGELKHGTISLITDGIPVIALATSKSILAKTISNIQEVKARGAYVILVTNQKNINSNVYDELLLIKPCHELLTPILTIIPLQLLAYKVALKRNCDIDKPRNLAKSVTVE